jgi:hypothetical protein
VVYPSIAVVYSGGSKKKVHQEKKELMLEFELIKCGVDPVEQWWLRGTMK